MSWRTVTVKTPKMGHSRIRYALEKGRKLMGDELLCTGGGEQKGRGQTI